MTPAKPLKVVLVSPAIDPANGWGNITLELCTELAKSADVTLLLPREATVPSNLPFKALPVLPDLALYPFNWSNLLHYGAAADLIARHAAQADLLHSLFSFPYCVPASLAAKKARKPFIMGVQGTYGVKPLHHPLNGFLLRSVYRQAAKVLCASHYTERRIREECPWVNSLVLPNGVNFERFQHSGDAVRLRRGFGQGPLVLGVGALKPRKGFQILIEAMALVRERVPAAHCVLVGEGPQRGPLEKLIAARGLQGQVLLAGEKTGQALVDHFQACDVYAHTPLNLDDEFEGFGIVYVEAGACGKPVVGSKSGGVETAVEDGKTGLLVPEGDALATADALIKLLSDKPLARRLGENGRDRARALDWSRYVERLLEVYRGALENGVIKHD